jgi:hypothetical protein
LITDVPGATPVTRPVVELTVATLVVTLLHVPPPVALESKVVDPWQTVSVPVIGVLNTFTVITADLEQPLPPV